MPQDFDPVKWYEGKQKTAPQQPVKSAGDFDPVKWFEGGQKQPKGGVAEAEAALLRYDKFKPRQKPGVLSRTASNVATGAGQGAVDYIMRPAMAGAEAVGSAAGGDFRPARDVVERFGRGLLQPLAMAAGAPGYAAKQTLALQDIQRRQEARRGGHLGFQAANQASRQLDERAARDPSLSGRITRGVAGGVVGALPAIATGAVTGGSLPAMGAMAALQSMDAPENLPLNVGASVAPINVGRMARPIIQRLRGQGRATTPTITRPTNRLPAQAPASAVPDAPVTQQTPAILRRRALEDAPTAGLQTPPQRAPMRPRYDELPELIDAPPKPFEIQADLSERVRTPGAVGPRTQIELGFRTPAPKSATAAQAAQPRTPLLEQISAVRKAGLLSGPTTHIRNIGSTAIMQGMEQVSRLPAAIADLAVSAVTRQRTVSAPAFRNASRSSYSAAVTGLKEAGQILRRGLPQAQATALQVAEINSRSAIVNAYTRGVFRTMGAADRFFRSMAFNRAIRDRAKSLAMTEARQGKIRQSQVNQRMDSIVANPPEDMAANAIADAELATFNNDNLINQGLTGFKGAIEGARGGRAVNFSIDMIAPFVRTPTNVIARALEYGGGGYVKNAGQISAAIFRKLRGKQGFTPEQQRRFSQSFGRATTGTAGLVTLGYLLGEAGYATGFNEESPGIRARDEAAGRQAGSVYDPIGGKWRRVAGFSPFGTLIAIGATLSRMSRRDEDDPEASALGRVAKTAASAIGEQPLLIGSKDVSEVFTRPGTTPEKLGRLAGSFVPTVVSQSGEIFDDTKREAEGFGAQIQRRIPGLRNQLPVDYDALGREIPSQPGSIIDPTSGRTAKDKQRPLEAELVRLDLGLSKPQKRRDETESKYRERSKAFGQSFEGAATTLVKSGEYRKLDDTTRREVFDSLKRELHDQAARSERDGYRLSPSSLIERTLALLARRKEKEATKQ